MFKNVPVRHTIDFEGKQITLETGLLAQQAMASVLATCEGTTVLAVVTAGKQTQGDYFPLQVIYEERYYAAGKMKDSLFNRREGRPNDNAILTGRMIDRSLRSLFDPSIRTEIQIVITVLSVDRVNQPDTLSVLAASTALSLCEFLPKNDETSTSQSLVIGQSNPEEEERTGVGAIIFNPKLQKYGVIQLEGKNYFQSVAGGLEKGEGLQACLVREVAEETGIIQVEHMHALGEKIVAHFYHQQKSVHRKAIGYPFLIVSQQIEPVDTKLEAHEKQAFSWQDSRAVYDSLQLAEDDIREFLTEQFSRGVSKAIQLGYDVVSDPKIFDKKFIDSTLTKPLFKGSIACLRIGQKPIKSQAELIFGTIEPTLESLSSLNELKSIESQLTPLLEQFDSTNPTDREYGDKMTRLLAKKSPAMGIHFKEMIDKVEYAPAKRPDLDSRFLINPTYQDMLHSPLDLVISGNGENIVMVECGADIVPEKTISEALEFSLEPMKKLITFQSEFVQMCRQ